MLCELISMKFEAKQKSLILRRKGHSLKEISQFLNVSKSTVSVWVRDVYLSDKAKSRLLLKITKGQFFGAQKRREYGDNKNKLLKEEARKEFSLITPDLNGRIICAMIYWCEGAKRIVARLHLHEYHDPKKQHLFWSKALGIPLDRFQKFYLKPHTGKVVRENYPGCVSIRYYDSIVARKILYLSQAFLGKI